MKCFICNERRAKRPCPAKGADICAQCCGEKRVLDIACPESCDYLKAGRERERQQLYARRIRVVTQAKASRYSQVFDKRQDAIMALEVAIAEARRAARSLTDREVAEAATLMLKTLQTEDSGILYEHTSTSPQVEMLRRLLRDAIMELRRPRQAGQDPLRLSEALSCVELVLEMATDGMNASLSALGYADLLARLLPARSHIERSGSSLILPGR